MQPVSPRASPAAASTGETAAAIVDSELRRLFGPGASSEGPLAQSGAGRRFRGLDLSAQLSPEQVVFLLDSLAEFCLLCIAGQDLGSFSLAKFETFANHWGAPAPHPNNFTRGGKPAQGDGAADGEYEMIPFEHSDAAMVNKAFPGELSCLPHKSPVVLVVNNMQAQTGVKVDDAGRLLDAEGKVIGEDSSSSRISGGSSWHTDIE